MTSPMSIATSMLGKREGPEHAALTEYLKNGGVNLDPATTAWCAAFVNSSLAQAGMKGTGSNLAKSFLNYGSPTDKPQKGDIAVFSRGDANGPYGHVGFYDSVNPDGSIHILAGNQGNSVSYGDLPASRLLGYRSVGSSATTAPNPYAGMADGPKGQEAYAPPAAAPTQVAQAPQQHQGLLSRITGGAVQPPKGLMELMNGKPGSGGDKGGGGLLGALAALQPQEAPQIQPMQAQQGPTLADYLTQFMQSRMS